MKVGVEVTHTFNLGNYESVKPSVWVEDEVGEDETPKQAYQRVTSIAHKLWAGEFKLQLSEHAANRKEQEKKNSGR